MRAMVLEQTRALRIMRERPTPEPKQGDILVEIAACGVCRTDLHVVDGEPRPTLPIVPGHEIAGRIAAIGSGVAGFAVGDRVGVPWLGSQSYSPILMSALEGSICSDVLPALARTIMP
jgi:propanol-preferring alcohol dehydrogenase